MLLHSLLCESQFDLLQLVSVFILLSFVLCWVLFLTRGSLCLHPDLLLTAPQAYADSDVDLFTWGTPITAIALFTILVHLGIETKTWVSLLL